MRKSEMPRRGGLRAEAAVANVERLNVLESFKRVVAPFDGVVTARKTDIGALITANGDSGPELFSVADLKKNTCLRACATGPTRASSGPAWTAFLKLPQFPERTFEAKLDTTSNSIDHDSRSVLAEFLADNPKGELWPGTYAESHIQLPSDPHMLHVPTSALMFSQGGHASGDDRKRQQGAAEGTSRWGRDLGTQVEVLSGVAADDRVIDSPPDSLAEGDTIRVQPGRS